MKERSWLKKLDVYGPGDFNGDGVCTEEDTTNIKQAVTNKKCVGKSALMACDFNGDGRADGYDLEEAFGISAVDNYVYFDTKYGDNERHYFDLYIPKGKKTVGIVLMLHGGAWIGGDENEFAGRLEQVAEAGYAGVAVRYRYIDEKVNLDDIMDDIEQAMKPFFTTQSHEERTGMGFSLMLSFMDKVKVESEPGKGTIVRMEKRLTDSACMND